MESADPSYEIVKEGEKINDDNKCTICKTEEYKYKCPSCPAKYCSLTCSKEHKPVCLGREALKEDKHEEVKLDESNIETEMRFLEQGHQILGRCGPIAQAEKKAENMITTLKKVSNEPHNETEDSNLQESKDIEVHVQTCAPDRQRQQLVAEFRRRKSNNRFIFTLENNSTAAAENKTFYEHFSQTVFWTIRLIFADTAEKYSILVHKVPETIRFVTLIRQFVSKPKHAIALNFIGEYDEVTLKSAYKDVQLEHIDLLMQTHNEDGVENKYHRIFTDKPLQYSFDNTHIIEFPTLIVTANPKAYMLVNEADRKTLQESWRAIQNAGRPIHQPYYDYDNPGAMQRGSGARGRFNNRNHRGFRGRGGRGGNGPWNYNNRGYPRFPSRGGYRGWLARPPLGPQMRGGRPQFGHHSQPITDQNQSANTDEGLENPISDCVDPRYTNSSVNDRNPAKLDDEPATSTVSLQPMKRAIDNPVDPVDHVKRACLELTDEHSKKKEAGSQKQNAAEPVNTDFFGFEESNEVEPAQLNLPQVRQIH